jgi:DedD protein
MGLLDIFKRQGAAGTAAAGEPVELARARARRRLIGAVVLLGVGVVAFPLLFETQPRPIPVDIPIEIPSRDGAPPLAMPPPKVAAHTGSAAAAPAARAPASSVPASAAEPRVELTKPDAAAKEVPPKPVAAPPPAPKPAAEPAKPAPEPAKPAAEAAGRFVVQVGAFAEASAVREARARLEKIGLASYTQVVETSNGPRTRVRLGAYGSREEAEKAAARLKAAGLPGAVLTL